MRIVYQNPEGGTCIITPTPEGMATLGLDAIAAKDVPKGLSFKFVAPEDIPATRQEIAAWAVQALKAPDGVGK